MVARYLGELAKGSDVISFVTENPVDIVLLDLNLGMMNGLTLLEELTVNWYNHTP